MCIWGFPASNRAKEIKLHQRDLKKKKKIVDLECNMTKQKWFRYNIYILKEIKTAKIYQHCAKQEDSCIVVNYFIIMDT